MTIPSFSDKITDMNTAKKITTFVPSDLLEKAQKVTGKSITQTIKIGLELLARQEIYKELLALKGTYKFSLDLKKLREDR